MNERTIMGLRIQSVTDIITNSSSESFCMEDYEDDYIWEFFRNLDGAKSIAEERKRQINKEGFDIAHDDHYKSPSELIEAAIAYAQASLDDGEDHESINTPANWPWDPKWFKPTTKRGDLVKAGALIAAAIDYIDRH